MHHSVFTASNRLVLLNTGRDFFPALFDAINAANSLIHIETYIFSYDDTGTALVAALERAAQRGVVVHLVVDWIGTGRAAVNALRATAKKLQAQGAPGRLRIRLFNPWFLRGVTRLHRKMACIDGEILFVGGINLTDDMFSDNRAHRLLPGPRWDFAVRIEGPIVQKGAIEMQRQWRRLGNISLRERWRKFRTDRDRTDTPLKAPVLAALVLRDNLRNRRTIQTATMRALGKARKVAYIANPYFAPGRGLRRALEDAARRGVDVRLIVGVGHYPLQDAVTQYYYPRLLRAGVRLYEYRETELHAKVAVIDHEWATVGSSNYDGFSLLVNKEANLVVKDEEFAAQLERDILDGLARSVEIRLADTERVPFWQKTWSTAAFHCYRLVMRVITLGTNSR